MAGRSFGAILAASSLSACVGAAPSSTAECSTDEDCAVHFVCASGSCRPEGRCGPERPCEPGFTCTGGGTCEPDSGAGGAGGAGGSGGSGGGAGGALACGGRVEGSRPAEATWGALRMLDLPPSGWREEFAVPFPAADGGSSLLYFARLGASDGEVRRARLRIEETDGRVTGLDVAPGDVARVEGVSPAAGRGGIRNPVSRSLDGRTLYFIDSIAEPGVPRGDYSLVASTRGVGDDWGPPTLVGLGTENCGSVADYVCERRFGLAELPGGGAVASVGREQDLRGPEDPAGAPRLVVHGEARLFTREGDDGAWLEACDPGLQTEPAGAAMEWHAPLGLQSCSGTADGVEVTAPVLGCGGTRLFWVERLVEAAEDGRSCRLEDGSEWPAGSFDAHRARVAEVVSHRPLVIGPPHTLQFVGTPDMTSYLSFSRIWQVHPSDDCRVLFATVSDNPTARSAIAWAPLFDPASVPPREPCPAQPGDPPDRALLCRGFGPSTSPAGLGAGGPQVIGVAHGPAGSRIFTHPVVDTFAGIDSAPIGADGALLAPLERVLGVPEGATSGALHALTAARDGTRLFATSSYAGPGLDGWWDQGLWTADLDATGLPGPLRRVGALTRPACPSGAEPDCDPTSVAAELPDGSLLFVQGLRGDLFVRAAADGSLPLLDAATIPEERSDAEVLVDDLPQRQFGAGHVTDLELSCDGRHVLWLRERAVTGGWSIVDLRAAELESIEPLRLGAPFTVPIAGHSPIVAHAVWEADTPISFTLSRDCRRIFLGSWQGGMRVADAVP